MLDSLKANKEIFSKQLLIKIAIFLSAVIVGIIALVVIKNGIKKELVVAQDLRGKIEELNLSGEAFSTLAKQYQLIGPYSSDLENSLPTKDRLIEFSKEVFNLASSLGMDINFLFKEEEVINNLSAIKFSIVFNRVSLVGLSSFLEAFENSRYFIDIDSFDVSKVSDASVGGGKNLSVVVNGRVFIKNEKK